MADKEPRDKREERDDEEEILVINRSVWHKPSQFILSLLLTFSFIPLYFLLRDVEYLKGAPLRYTLLSVSLLGLLWLLMYLFTTKILATYRITPRYCTSEIGFVSRRIAEVEIEHIRNINVSQGFIQRILGIGTVEISSAGGAGVEVWFESVADPVEIRRLINSRRNGDDDDGE